MNAYLRVVLAIAEKDLRVEARTFHRLAAMAAFALLAGVLYHYGFDMAAGRTRAMLSGLVWLTIIFAGVLGVGRTFYLEERDGALEGLLLTPIPRSALYLGKVLANYLLLIVVVAFVLFVLGLFFRTSFVGVPASVYLLVLVGTLGFVAVGTLFSAVTVRSSMGETLLPILLFPLLIPVVIFGAGATGRMLAGLPPSETAGSLRILVAYAIVALWCGAILFAPAVEDR